MTGAELIRKIRKLGRDRQVEVRLDEQRGKGSHAMLHYGDRKCTVPDRKRELRTGTLNAMLAQLGLTKSELE